MLKSVQEFRPMEELLRAVQCYIVLSLLTLAAKCHEIHISSVN